MTSSRASAVYEGWVQHRRHLPRPHAFRYRMFQLYLDLAELPGLFEKRWLWSLERRNLAQFRREDYFGDPKLALDDAVRNRVESETGRRPRGPIRLLTHGRYFGVLMNPVSFYYGFSDDGQELDWVLAEITNTPWGERHAYLLRTELAHRRGDAYEWEFRKDFHVSPFLPMDRDYLWRLAVPGDRLNVHMEVSDGEQREFDATLSLERHQFSAHTLASCLLRYPWLTAKVAFGIYWQAARLWFKRIPFHPHPDSIEPHPESR